jgi:hypothetical protein
MRFLLLLLASLPLGALAQPAPPPAQPNVILFIGNSFTHGAFAPVLGYNTALVTDENLNTTGPRSPRQHADGPWAGIPGIFKKLTDEAGFNYEIHLEVITGETLKYHYDNALDVIKQPRWNTVVMHDHSLGPTPARHTGSPERFYTYATKLEQAVHEANPQAKVYLYETWARADQTYPEGKGYSGLPIDSMQTDLHRAYYQQAAQDKQIAGVAPAGDAWLRAIRQGLADPNPYDGTDANKVDLWGRDHYHPSRYGSYLNACVIMAEVTGYDPRKLGAKEQAAADLGIAPDVAKKLQKIAWEQVKAGRKG